MALTWGWTCTRTQSPVQPRDQLRYRLRPAGDFAPELRRFAPRPGDRHRKIAMTAPVTQQGGEGVWLVRFVMPSSYTMQTLPKPNNTDVILKEIDGKRFAVIRFSGLPKPDSLAKQTKELEAFIQEKRLRSVSEPTYAFFNPPWTLPFLRRNEVMIEIGT